MLEALTLGVRAEHIEYPYSPEAAKAIAFFARTDLAFVLVFGVQPEAACYLVPA